MTPTQFNQIVLNSNSREIRPDVVQFTYEVLNKNLFRKKSNCWQLSFEDRNILFNQLLDDLIFIIQEIQTGERDSKNPFVVLLWKIYSKVKDAVNRKQKILYTELLLDKPEPEDEFSLLLNELKKSPALFDKIKSNKKDLIEGKKSIYNLI